MNALALAGVETFKDQVIHIDLLTLCTSLPPQSVSLILCDLPYGSLEIGWDSIIPFAPMWAAFKRLIHPQGAIVLTAKQPFSAGLINSNPAMYRYSWYWEKQKGANVTQTAYRPLAVIEEILIFSHAPAVFSVAPTMRYFPQKKRLEKPYKATFTLNSVAVAKPSAGSAMRNPERKIGTRIYEFETPRNLLYAPRDTAQYHPTQKPVALFEYLIRTYTQPGEIVLDPCVGSGTTALAARNTGRHYICGDTSEEYVAIARQRLAAPYTPSMFTALPQPPAPKPEQHALFPGEAPESKSAPTEALQDTTVSA